MRHFLSFLLSIAMFTGLISRVEGCVDGCLKTEDACCQADTTTSTESPADDHDSCPENEHCPVEGHHHHGPCQHGLQAFALEKTDCDLPAPSAIRLGRLAGDQSIPESPVRELDKPPLI